MIPEEAIAAAAEALRFRTPTLPPATDQDEWWDDAKAALEAAVPFIIEALADQAADEYKRLPHGAAKSEAGLASIWLTLHAVTEKRTNR